MLRSSWRAGPASGAGGPVLVSVTEFTSCTFLRLPGIARAAFELRREWPLLDGAVGMWLWATPLSRRVGSVSVWASEEALHGFVRLPAHIAVMREHGSSAAVRATRWWTDGHDQADIWRDAQRRLIFAPSPP
ncbi:hypothetical protein [Allokutzneria sp. NRRL B-24872]|uniref:hypothetical protein n=1 Tax=Allokutzneria sp. NRRL B-24872 TaxID=1137961 RepID=UPI0011775D78|nr:hypothetical protein [Allokutzneria sp. NRRL B-24872]